MNNIEDTYRDKLAENLHLLDPSYRLIGKEYYLPKGKLTKSFIDILARDKDNNYIIIEVKRSNQAAREAIHEIYKYTEAIKDTYNVSIGEIKSIIISTEWAELFIPFSVFHNETDISVSGYRLLMDNDNNISSLEKIMPCKTSKGRLFSPVQDCNLYRTPADLYKGLQSHFEVFPAKQIKDFVMVILMSKQFTDESYHQEIRKVVEAALGGKENTIVLEFGDKRRINFIIYTAFQRQNNELYWKLIEKDGEGYQYLKEEIESMDTKDEETISNLLEDKLIYNLEPFPFCNDTEIAYPAKFSEKIIAQEQWQIVQLIRSPSFAKNTLLTDEKILAEISGHSGSDNVLFHGKCTTAHKASFIELKENIASALKYNIVWDRHTSEFLNGFDSSKNWEVEANIYSPSHIFLTIFKMITDEVAKWTPLYSISARSQKQHNVFLGTFRWNKQKTDFDTLVTKHYENDAFNIILPLTWGGFEENNDEILQDLGLSYTSYKVERLATGDVFYQYDNYKWVRVEQIVNGLEDFIIESGELIYKILDTYKTYYAEIPSAD